ncbi:3666_t:CDS:2 [Gigaspora margarita]|uniref:3666_t:CDS:1 n=1 Tax=Gigaspora margarita TaxID=4874 RepID=A0ABN7VHZ0_GIGMA|nr:3666_t:CDS:2 [Gigaspora margarita]
MSNRGTEETYETQIGRAVKASNELVNNFHRDGVDRGCIATFNNTMTIRQNFTENETLIHRSLDGLVDVADGGTRLYDSMVDVIRTFHRYGNRTRPWVLVVVTDGDDNDSILSYNRCIGEVSRLFTNDSSNFLFVLGVGDNVDSRKLEEMADIGNFIYIPVKDFYVLEFAFLMIAYKITTSRTLSLTSLSIGDVSASWAEIRSQRELSNVAIDYALLIDVSGSMNVNILPPAPKCFVGHDLKEKFHIGNWWCDVCGEDGKTSKSKYYCNYCDFDACPSHCEPGRECKPRSRCRNRHPLRYTQLSTTRGWICNECNRISTGKHLRCHQCDYDICSDCYFLELMVNMSLISNSSNY